MSAALMAYRWVDHTAELELSLDCPTEAAVFEDAVRALAELLGDGRTAGPVAVELALREADRATLLASWLDELVFRVETEGLVPEAAESVELDAGGLHARVRGHRGEPRHLVKGVTYHRLSFEPAGDGYRATVVLDV